MHEPILENHTDYSIWVLAEFYRKMRTPAFKTVLAGCCVVMIGAMIIMEAYTSPATWLLLAYLVFLIWGLPVLQARATLQQRRKLCNDTLPETVITFGDTIVVTEGSHRSEYQYSQILRIVPMKRSSAMMIDRRIGILVDPRGFNRGTYADFLSLMREKNPGIMN